MKKFKLSASTLVLGLAVGTASLVTPTPSYAWCSYCGDTAQALAQHTSSLISAISQANLTILNAIQSSTESITGVNEKRTTTDKELEQGNVNYKAANKTQENTLEAQEKFTIEGSKPFQVCQQVAQQKVAVAAATQAQSATKSQAARRTFETIYPPSAVNAVNNSVDKYDSKYCSDADAALRGCTPADPIIQSAPVRSDILLAPTTNYTYSEKEYEASGDFIKTLMDPVKPAELPLALQQTESGKAYTVKKMNANAKMSVVANSLESIRANKKSSDNSAGNAAGYNGGLSILGLMKKFTDDKFGNKEYSKQLQIKNENGLLKELNIQMAFTNWVGFQSYLQNDRIEAILATKLAQDVTETGSKEQSQARLAIGR